MATTYFLVRHAAHALVDRVLVGRMAGVVLAEEGRRQARRVADRFCSLDVALVQSSPRERACETAQFIAARTSLDVQITNELDELDAGEWTGLSFDQLRADPRWLRWNAARSAARPPQGESMAELQRRVLDHLRRLRDMWPEGRLVLVTHAEVIRAALLHYLNRPLDAFGSVEIGPASISTLLISDTGAQVLAIDER
jgi:broad specificity phosphatase PhoE